MTIEEKKVVNPLVNLCGTAVIAVLEKLLV